MTAETQVNAQTLPIGYVLEDYRITSVLGQGGFGITYKATEEMLRRDVAIKEYMPRQFAFRDGSGTVRPRGEDDQELFEWGLTRFVDEGRALAMFRHPNIASVIRYIRHNGTAYLVMEFEEGMDLEHWLTGRPRPDEARLVSGILVPVLEGLARVHDKGLLHRDIKPDNIFIRRNGTPVLIDFGASRPHGPEAASRLTSIISAGYSPFEQYGSGERQGPWSDLYALAGTMYRVISGGAPPDAITRQQGAALTPAAEVGKGAYSQPFLDALDRALSLEIAERPRDAREFLTLLGVAAPPPDDADATVVRRDAAPQAGRRSRRGPLLAAGLVVLLAGAAGAYLTFAPDGLPPVEVGEAGSAQAAGGGAPTDAAGGEVAGEPSPADGTLPDGAESAGRIADDGLPVEAEDAAADSATEAATTDAVPAEPAPDTLGEDGILAGLELPEGFGSWRQQQLVGWLARYRTFKFRFDACRDAGCADQATLQREVQQAMRESLTHDGVEQTLVVENPKRLPNDTCPLRIDVRETLSIGDTRRSQARIYCIDKEGERELQSAGEVRGVT